MKVKARKISFIFAAYLRVGQSARTIERLGIDNNFTKPERTPQNSGKDREDT
jgi:hypothetical protein